MMKSILVFLLGCFFCQMIVAQIEPRKAIRGQVVNDSIKVDNVVVFNINSQSGTSVDAEGFFELPVRAKDTLFFSSLSFNTKKIVVTEKQVEDKFFKVELIAFVNKLEEIVISNNKVKPKITNSQSIVDTKYFDDYKSSPKNPYVYDGTITDGIDFVRLYKDVFKSSKKKKENMAEEGVSFTDIVMQKIDYGFYKKTLHLKDQEIRLFLVYCEKDVKDVKAFNNKTVFEIMDFLILKHGEFEKMKTE